MENLTSYAHIEMCLTCPKTKNLVNLYTADILNKLQIFIYIEQSHLTELPKFICQSCVDALNTAYAFKEQCENRTTKILNIIKKNKINFLSDQNLETEPQIDISLVKNEDLNPLELNIEVVSETESLDSSLANVEIKDEFEVIEVDADVKTEEIIEQDTENLPKKIKEYKCDFCDMVFKKPSLRAKHKLSEHKSEPNPDLKYSCNLCDEKFRYKSEFFVHRKTHKTCPVCNKEYSSDRKMLQHVRLNHTNPRTETCHICGKKILRQNLTRHIRSFHNKEFLHFCEVCKKGFYESALLKIHMIIHTEIRPFKCDICEKTFKTEKYLELHSNVHSDDKKSSKRWKSGEAKPKDIPCEYCEQMFCSMKDYDFHLQRHEEHDKSFQCNVCNRKFAIESRLALHQKIHIEPFKICQICGKSLASLSSFNIHMRIHTNEMPYKCTLCPKQYKQRNQLIIHKRCHNGERPFKCKLCNLAFRQRNHLDTHQNVHSTEKKFSCDICGVCVGYKYNLISHIKNVHQKERNYQCTHCTESYFSNNMLKKHLQQKHKDLLSDL